MQSIQPNNEGGPIQAIFSDEQIIQGFEGQGGVDMRGSTMGEYSAGLDPSQQQPGDPNMMPVPMGQMGGYMPGNPEHGSDLFARHNDLRVIQEYNTDEGIPKMISQNFWGLTSKSLKLGFWEDKDEMDIFLHKNVIRMGYIMSRAKHRYTFEDRHMMNQLDFMTYCDFKRGVGVERHRINERILQASSISQNIQGFSGGGASQGRGGVMGFVKSFLG